MRYRMAFYVASFLFVAAANAWACSLSPDTPEPTAKERFDRANTILVARMTKVEEIEAPEGFGNFPLVEGTLRPIELLKGELPAGNKVRGPVYGPGNCSIPFFAGWDYILYLDGEHNFVLWPSGSEAYFNIDGKEPQEALAELRALAKR